LSNSRGAFQGGSLARGEGKKKKIRSYRTDRTYIPPRPALSLQGRGGRRGGSLARGEGKRKKTRSYRTDRTYTPSPWAGRGKRRIGRFGRIGQINGEGGEMGANK